MTETNNSISGSKFKINYKTFIMIGALLLIWLFFGLFTGGNFLKPRNISNLFRQMTIISFLSIGMVLVIVTGNIDLSVGSVCGFISATAAFLQAVFFPKILPALFPESPIVFLGILSTVLTIIISLGVGLLIGVWQGSLIAFLGIPAFIVTLGGMLIFRGGVLHRTQGKTIVPIEKSLTFISQQYINKSLGLLVAIVSILVIFLFTIYNRYRKKSYGFKLHSIYYDLGICAAISVVILAFVFIMNIYRGIPNPVALMVIIALVFTYISKNTRFGRYCYALGGNKEATRLSGVNIKGNIFFVFVLMGLLCAVSGIVLTGYVAAGTIGGGKDYELAAIAACVIGGTSLMGGEGTIFGALVGALIMASLENGMSVMNLPPHNQSYVKGMVLIIAVFIDVASKRKSFFVR